MNCALWLNKQKVHHASEIRENLDVASLRGYFLAGSLVDWLRENGGEKYAEKLSKISADDPELNKKIAKVFGGKPLISKPMQTGSSEKPNGQIPQGLGSAVSSYRLPSSAALGSANYGSGASGLFSYLQLSYFSEFWNFLQSFGTSSFGSFNRGSYSEWEWLFSLFRQSYGSFYLGSFSSFHEWEWEWLFRLFTGSSAGSFSGSDVGSFNRSFWNILFGSFGSFGSFGFGSLNVLDLQLPVLDEYDRIMLETLMRCPLDRFGYGVHNI